MNVNLRISPDAAGFIRKMLDEATEESVIVIFGFVRGSSQRWESDKPPLREDLIHAGRELIANLSSTLIVDYEIGINRLDRIPPEDIYVVDGIKIYLPQQLLPMVGARKIVLKNGTLEFEPPIESYEIQR